MTLPPAIQASASPFYQASVILTDAQIRTPGSYALVEAPRSGNTLVVLAAWAVMRKTTVYGNVGTAANVNINYGSDGGAATSGGNVDGDHFLFDDYPDEAVLYPQIVDFGVEEDSLSNYENRGLYVKIFNDTGVMTGGAATNTLKMTVIYQVISA